MFGLSQLRSIRAGILCSILFAPSVLSQVYENITDAIPQLQGLTRTAPGAWDFYLGGQNFTVCCLLAVNDSIRLSNGRLVEAETSYLTNFSFFESASQNNNFPCGAAYQGDSAGSPVVRVPFSYCSSNCGGWQRSQASKTRQWVGPLIGFILPDLVFCLVVPRRRKLELSPKFFSGRLDKVQGWLYALSVGLLAGLLVSLDTIIWLCTCFAFAGPMIVSGVYEALLDSRILHFVEETALTVDMKARLLFLILVGNLDLIDLSHGRSMSQSSRGSGDKTLVDAPGKSSEHKFRPSAPIDARYQLQRYLTAQSTQDSPWLDIERKIAPLQLYPCSIAPQWPMHNDPPADFGSTVGGPVVFFAVAFIYSLIDILTNLGDSDTAHALAFGLWWMTVPYIAIVAGLLLAGNNPNTLEAVIGIESSDVEEDNVWLCERLGLGFGLTYPSKYKTAWMWFRGRQKRHWVDRVLDFYTVTDGTVPGDRLLPDEKTLQQRQKKFRSHPGFTQDSDMTTDPDMHQLCEITRMGWASWAIILFITGIFIFTPFILAYLVSYFTPRVGLSCRTFTYIMYTITQVFQIGLFLWAHANSRTSLDDSFDAVTNTATLFHPNGPFRKDPENQFWSYQSLRCGVWYSSVFAFGGGAIFTAIGGTLMQM
ncbi:hypothetical protein BP5796_02034 [Coleophoma crateriformis]|uniref:Uncharacterized protein n=1 Tax=Coleophoma crateriformis TaxID=565419 RepID=A0A3D8T280_9HELO|nr:hypothetical protein BP5796_02034 [Coleophoma crateriformis]